MLAAMLCSVMLLSVLLNNSKSNLTKSRAKITATATRVATPAAASILLKCPVAMAQE
jgi:hypothetical protein